MYIWNKTVMINEWLFCGLEFVETTVNKQPSNVRRF